MGGFGRNYFRLSAILAASVAPSLRAREVDFRERLSVTRRSPEGEEEEDPPLEESEALLPFLSAKPCHCNRHFKRMARLMFALYRYIPRCPYYTTFYAFRRTGVHPPFLSF